MKVVAYIPVKLNNQRLPGKNLLPLGGKKVCDYIFSTISSVKGIDERYVFCSDESIRTYLPAGIKFLRRDSRLDGSQVKTMEIVNSFIKMVNADIYILTHVTSPFLKSSSIEIALQKVISEGYDSAFCVERIQSLCWFRGEPLNYDINSIPRTQDIDPVLVETNGFYIFRKEVAIERNCRIGNNPYIFEVDKFEASDIDTADDYHFAEQIIKYMGKEEK
jgi:CMP-N-acetylneuraminic acid synthetase